MTSEPVMKPIAKAVLAAAQQRGVADGLPYFGAILPTEAGVLLESLPNARLIDVRTRAEWDYVGRVPGSTLIEWNQCPGSRRRDVHVQQRRRAGEHRSRADLGTTGRKGRAHHLRRSHDARSQDPVAVPLPQRAAFRRCGAGGGRSGIRHGVQRARGIRGRQGCGRAPQHARWLAQGRVALGSGVEQIDLITRLRRRAGVDEELDVELGVTRNPALDIGSPARVLLRRECTAHHDNVLLGLFLNVG